jgi:hypothetical protein
MSVRTRLSPPHSEPTLNGLRTDSERTLRQPRGEAAYAPAAKPRPHPPCTHLFQTGTSRARSFNGPHRKAAPFRHFERTAHWRCDCTHVFAMRLQ